MTRPRGIVIVSPGGLSRGGGIGSVTRAMSGWLAAEQPDLPVFVIDPRGTDPDRWRIGAFLAAIVRLITLRLRHRPDILHLQVSEGGSFARKGLLLGLGRVLGMRIVLHHHGARLAPFVANCRPTIRAFVRRVVQAADVNIVLGASMASVLTGPLGLSPDRVVIQRNAVRDPGKPGGRRERAHFLLPAVLSERKGTADFLRAFASIAGSTDARATLAGEGDIAFYRQLAAALGIADRVRFTGWLQPEEVAQLQASCTALVLPSYEEGLPMAILEALAAGLPVVATPVGSIPEILVAQTHALLVEPGDGPALAAAMRRLLDDPALAERLAANGRLLFEQSLSLDAAMETLVALYRRLSDRGISERRRVARGEPGAHHDVGEHGGAAAPEGR